MSYHTRNRKSSKQQLAYRVVSCPTCGAKPGDMCVVLHNLQATKFAHSARRDKYKHEIGGMNTPIVVPVAYTETSYKMNVTEEVFARRCERMVQLITMHGPRVMIGKEAQLIAQALEHPWKYAVRQWLFGFYAAYLRLRYRNEY